MQAGGAAEDVVADLGFDAGHQLLENLVGFGLVFHQRIALAVGAQADALAQAVHAVEMLLPELVHGIQDGVALDRFEGVGIFATDFQFINVAHGLADELADGKLGRAQAGKGGAFHRLFLAGLGRLDDFLLGHAQREIEVDPVGQRPRRPLLRFGVVEGQFPDFGDDDFLHDVHQAVAHVVGVDHLVAEAVNDFALLVHHVVVFQRAFAALEVLLFDPLLRRLDGFIEHEVLQFLAFLQPDPLHHLDDFVRAEQAHEVVLQGNEKVGGAGIALARATSAQLAVNAAGFVALGADDVQAAQPGDAFAQFDVGAAAGHVGGDGDGSRAGRRGRRFRPPAGDTWR